MRAATERSGGRPVFDEVVATTGTADVDEGLTPFGRIQKANEAAVRLNIVDVLRRFQVGR